MEQKLDLDSNADGEEGKKAFFLQKKIIFVTALDANKCPDTVQITEIPLHARNYI